MKTYTITDPRGCKYRKQSYKAVVQELRWLSQNDPAPGHARAIRLRALQNNGVVGLRGWRFELEAPRHTGEHANALQGALQAGTDAADALHPGGIFGGAWYWASEHGYDEGTELREWFTHGFLSALPAQITVCQDTGTITRIGD